MWEPYDNSSKQTFIPGSFLLPVYHLLSSSKQDRMLKSWNAGSAWCENLCQGNRNTISIDQSEQLKYYICYLEVQNLGRWCEWRGDIEMWAFSPWKHFFYYYSNGIKLTLTNTSHIVPSNCNVETFIFFFFWVLTSQSNLSKIKSVISDHIIGFVHLLSFSILVYSRESLNCSWHLLMAHVHQCANCLIILS